MRERNEPGSLKRKRERRTEKKKERKIENQMKNEGIVSKKGKCFKIMKFLKKRNL